MDDAERDELETDDDDAGFLGGGGPAAEFGDDDEDLDEHGDNLATAPDEES